MGRCMAQPISRRWRWHWNSASLNARVNSCRSALHRPQSDGHGSPRISRGRSSLTNGLDIGAASGQATGALVLLDVLRAVDAAYIEQTREKRRALRANLEFYKGVVYLALGIPKEFFTASLTAARVRLDRACDGTATGHRIVRPAAHYVGPAPREFAS